jgi:hypothetical protein
MQKMCHYKRKKILSVVMFLFFLLQTAEYLIASYKYGSFNKVCYVSIVLSVNVLDWSVGNLGFKLNKETK